MLLADVKVISDKIKLHVINIELLSPEILNLINNNLVEICEGNSGSKIELTKANFRNFLKSKDIRTKHGAVAEFFIHLYLKQLGFKQEFLFLNLEEGSIKKGFDGYFSHSKEEYLVESKSGNANSVGISHKKKLKEAYDDVSSVVSGSSKKSQNNPWRNAYNHASHIDVGSASSIRQKIKQISDLYDQGQFKDVSLFNIVPCSTIFLEDDWDDKFSSAILNESNFFFEKLKAKSTNIICVSKSTFTLFIEYLEG